MKKLIEKNWRKVFIASFYLLVFAFTFTQTQSGEATEGIKTLMEKVIDIVKIIGQAVMVLGVIQFGIAFKSEDPTAKSKALMTIGAGGIFTVAGSIFSFFGTGK